MALNLPEAEIRQGPRQGTVAVIIASTFAALPSKNKGTNPLF